MSDDRLRDLLRELKGQQGAPETFKTVVTARCRRWRLQRARAAVTAAFLITSGFVAFQALHKEARQQVAEVVLPDTTDWLLETPPPDWLNRASRRDDKEKTDAN